MDKFSALIGSIRQYTDDIKTYEHHDEMLPPIDSEQMQKLEQAEEILKSIYFQMFHERTSKTAD